jgi:hypothetical protein
MIRYALSCDHQHEFDGWFRDSAAFDEQAAGGLVTCPSCNSSSVEKRIMAPGVARSDRDSACAPTAPATPDATPMALIDDKARELRAMIAALREHVTKTADYVGPRFAEEARRIHDGEVETRSIYGEATADEARALAEDGIPALPLPIIPDERN